MRIPHAFISALLLGSALFAADPIGKVISVTGKVSANNRSLSRGDSVFVSDLIDVAAKSKVQIKFIDGGIINLIPSSQFRIDSYEFKKDKQESSSELVKGGFRAVSGSIARSNPENYAVKTPVATIGVRGTIFQANIVQESTYFGCDSGSVTISSSSGAQVDIAAGQFVSIDPLGQFGSITDIRPDALSTTIFIPPPDAESLERAESSSPPPPPAEAAPQEESSTEEESEASQDQETEEAEIPETEGNPPCS
jgi:hypothetical protein